MEPEERHRLETELALEVSLLHPLATLDRRVLARRMETNEILVEISPHACECAVVSLTWSSRVEMDNQRPHTKLYPTLVDWITDRMIPDHAQFLAKLK